MEHKINWRDASKELPEVKDKIILLCIVLVRYHDSNGNLIEEISYDQYFNNHEFWDRWSNKEVVAWCYMEELLDTVPEEFMEMGNEQV